MGGEFSRERLCKGIWDKDIDEYPEEKYCFTLYGYKCRLERTPFWVYCGLVTLPFCHPDFNKNYKNITGINIHGGITYGSGGVFGFDCFSGDDMSPVVETLKLENPEFKVVERERHYWTFPEAKKELKNLAYQFKNRESPGSPIILLRMAKHKITTKID